MGNTSEAAPKQTKDNKKLNQILPYRIAGDALRIFKPRGIFRYPGDLIPRFKNAKSEQNYQ